MSNHRWTDISFSKYDKEERCEKCGVYRIWIGGDMQCWEYWWPKSSYFKEVKRQFKRPDCKGK